MALRIPWDKYEAALLIDTAVQIENSVVDRKKGIESLFVMLRTKALNSGIEIDSVYRNNNGISMQLSIISSLLFDRKNQLHDATQLFEDMVYIYKNDATRYEEILKEARDGN